VPRYCYYYLALLLLLVALCEEYHADHINDTHALLNTLPLTTTAGLFHKGEQAAEDVKHEGKKAAADAERSAQEGKEEAKGIFGGV
jgi:hypothetical protein